MTWKVAHAKLLPRVTCQQTADANGTDNRRRTVLQVIMVNQPNCSNWPTGKSTRGTLNFNVKNPYFDFSRKFCNDTVVLFV
jgi:hypothetical protein